MNAAFSWRVLGSRQAISFFLSSCITAILLVTVFSQISWDEFSKLFLEIHIGLLGAYLALNVATLFVRTWRYQLLLEPMEQKRPAYFELLIATAVRNALVDFVPARLGELGFFYICKRYGIHLLATATTFGISIILDFAVLAALLLMLFLALQILPTASVVGAASASPALLVTLCFALVIVIAFSIIALKHGTGWLQWLASRTPQGSKVLRSLQRVFESAALYLLRVQNPRRYAVLVVLTAAIRTFKYLSLYLLLLAVVARWGHSASTLDPFVTICSFVMAELAASLPASGIMGFGAYEGVWTLIFSTSDVEIPSVSSVVFAVHVITQIVGYSTGLIAWAFFLGFAPANRSISDQQ